MACCQATQQVIRTDSQLMGLSHQKSLVDTTGWGLDDLVESSVGTFPHLPTRFTSLKSKGTSKVPALDLDMKSRGIWIGFQSWKLHVLTTRLLGKGIFCRFRMDPGRYSKKRMDTPSKIRPSLSDTAVLAASRVDKMKKWNRRWKGGVPRQGQWRQGPWNTYEV